MPDLLSPEFLNPTAVIYTFTDSDPWDTVLFPDTDFVEAFPLYQVTTVSGRIEIFNDVDDLADIYNTLTTVTDENGTLIASLIWRETLPDLVIYRGMPESINDWMHRPLFDSRYVVNLSLQVES